MIVNSEAAGTRTIHPWIGTSAALVAASAFAGTVGLATGTLGLTETMTQRLPWHSPLVGGLALAVIVGVPYSVLAWLAFRSDLRTLEASLLAGALLVGWIVVEVAIVREFSVLQLVYLVVGTGFALVGRSSWSKLVRIVRARTDRVR